MEWACDFRDLCNYGYALSDKEKGVQPHGSHLVLTLEQTNKRDDQKGHRLLYFQNNSIYFINEFDSSYKWSFAQSIDWEL